MSTATTCRSGSRSTALSIQQELPGNTVLTVAYVGSQGRNLFLRSITNSILPGATTIPCRLGADACRRASASSTATRRRSGRSASTTLREFDLVNFALGNNVPSAAAARSPPVRRDRLQDERRPRQLQRASADHQPPLHAGLTLGGQYQWGHSIGNTQGSNEAQTAQDPYNFNDDRGNNTFDIRHSANVTALYELPIGKGRADQPERLADTLLGGWMLGGVYNGRSGLPLDLRITRADVVIQCTNSGGRLRGGPSAAAALRRSARRPRCRPASPRSINTPGGNASRNTRRPDIVPGVDPFLSLDGGNLRLPQSGGLRHPAPGTYGNLSRNALFGPSFHQFDLTLQKRFRITEATAIEFRTEFYNLFNKANFANPPVTLNVPPSASLQPGQPIPESAAGNFGVINGTVGRTVGLGTNRQIQFSGRFVSN